ALLLQWYRAAPHMLEIGIAPLIGATVVTKKAWDRLSEADREAMRAAARAMEQRLRAEVPQQDRDAVAQMQRRRLTVATPSDAPAWREAGNAFAAQMRGTDRKSTRLNSSHVKNSYAVFCLKKKKI